MLDVLLAHAYFLCQDPHEQELMRPFPPLGLQYLVAYLRREGVPRTDWWDATFQPGPAAFDDALREAQPKLVGFYGHTITRPTTFQLLQSALDAGCRTVAGGPDPVQYLEEYLTAGVEVVVVGEGEHTLRALVQHLQDHRWRWDWDTLGDIPGIAFLRAGRVVRTPPRPLIRPLDSLPWPHRHRRDLDTYLSAWRARHGQTALSLTTSRGCPYHCTWCSKQVYGDTFRRRDVDAVIDEVEHLKATWRPDELWFVDDMFTLNRTWVHRFCSRMVERRAQHPFYLIGRAETLTDELLRALKEAGCYRIYVSAESGAQSVLDAMKKGTSLDDIYRAAERLHRHGIELGAFVMLGYPGEGREELHATRRMIATINPAVTLLSVAHPMKGTTFYDEVKQQITGAHGGRLTFEMRYPPLAYEAAQRLIWADRALAQGRGPRWRQRARQALWRGVLEGVTWGADRVSPR